jgi:GNAT superfamily N-acetyltransferase
MKNKINFRIRKIKEKDKEWIRNFLKHEWGSERIVSQNKIYYPAEFPGFLAVKDKKYLGLIIYEVKNKNCQILVIEAIAKYKGIGTALIARIKKEAKRLKCKKLWLNTTNDNVDALRFYQRRGFLIKAIYPNAVTYERKKLKPEIPLMGDYGIPIRDEIELEMKL